MSKKMKQWRRQRRARGVRGVSVLIFCALPVCFLMVIGSLMSHSASAYRTPVEYVDEQLFGDNQGLQQHVIDFFTAHDAREMIPIIACESSFQHFADDGTVLQNHEGSSAIGVAQIMASVHPDPQVLRVYNRRHNTNLTVKNFDITTLRGNLQYARVLYEVNGIRDWECAK